jgi:hypothetical protein
MVVGASAPARVGRCQANEATEVKTKSF